MARKAKTAKPVAKTVTPVKTEVPVETSPVKETIEKAAEVKETPVKKEAVKEVVAEKAEAVKEAVKEATAKVETAAKTAKKPAAKKTAPAKKEEVKAEVYVQFQGQEAVVADVIEKAKKQFVEEGHRASTIKSIQVYLKPEEYAAYYVINQKHAGRVDLF